MTTISMKHWLEANKRTRIASSDKWYLDFASGILPFSKGKEILNRYRDFIARYYLCEYYEGE